MSKDKNKYIFSSKTFACMLSFAAGMMGVYTFKLSNGIFGNGLTGDLLYIGINLVNKNYVKMLVYFFVIVFFSFGVMVAFKIRMSYQKNDGIENFFRRICLLIEAMIVLITYFIKNEMICLFMITFVLGIQIEIYDNMRGYGISTVNFVGNTKNAAENTAKFICNMNKKGLKVALNYYLTFIAFVIGGIFAVIIYEKIEKQLAIFCFLYLVLLYILSKVIIKRK